VAVVTPTTSAGSWSASSGASWLIVLPTSGASGAASYVIASANNGSAARQGVVTYSAGGVTAQFAVTQAGAASSSGDDHGSTLQTATDWSLVSQEYVRGSLETGADIDYFRVTASATGTWMFRSAESTGDPYGILYNASGAQLASDDDGAGNQNFLLSATLVAGQVYYVAIRNFDQRTTTTGPYAIVVMPPDDHGSSMAGSSSWPVASQSQVTGSLEVASDVDYFSFTAPASGTYTFRSGPSTGDVMGSLYGSNTALIASDNDGGGGRDFLVTAYLTSGVRYFVGIRNTDSAASTSGAYTITMTRR
jgi:hypothetical protein